MCRERRGCRVLSFVCWYHPTARFQHFENQSCHAAGRVSRSGVTTQMCTHTHTNTHSAESFRAYTRWFYESCIFHWYLLIVSCFPVTDAYYLQRSTHLHSSHARPSPHIAWHVVLAQLFIHEIVLVTTGQPLFGWTLGFELF